MVSVDTLRRNNDLHDYAIGALSNFFRDFEILLYYEVLGLDLEGFPLLSLKVVHVTRFARDGASRYETVLKVSSNEF